MQMRAWAVCAAAVLNFAGGNSLVRAAEPFSLEAEPAPDPRVPIHLSPASALQSPLWLAVNDAPPSPYPDYIPQREQEASNNGGVHFDLHVDWLSAYVYRGVDQTITSRGGSGIFGESHENAEQFDSEAVFDLGKLPHPFIGLFVNVFNNDPISRFEEVRPYFGLEWNIRPITIRGGYTDYIYPNRKPLDTQEVFAQLQLDDSRLLHTLQPLLSPYIFGAYDLGLYYGFYLEAGVRHDFVFEDYGVTLSPVGRVGYIINDPLYRVTASSRTFGLQHYDIGAIGNFQLNHFFNIDRRYGEWSINGYIFYTGRIDSDIRADTLVWGGVGLQFKY